MDYFECIESRRSVRSYKGDPVEEWKLERILEAGRIAPTAANIQAFRVHVLPTAGREPELRRIYDRGWFSAAPLVLVVSIYAEGCWRRGDGRVYGDLDAAIVIDHMILAATALGLGSCWVANFKAEAAREILALEPTLEPIILSPLGYAADLPPARQRKPLSELVVRSEGART